MTAESLVTKDTPLPPFMTTKGLAEILLVDQKKINRLISSGEIMAVDVGLKQTNKRPRWRVTAEAVREFIERRQSQPAASQTRKRNPAAGAIEI